MYLLLLSHLEYNAQQLGAFLDAYVAQTTCFVEPYIIADLDDPCVPYSSLYANPILCVIHNFLRAIAINRNIPLQTMCHVKLANEQNLSFSSLILGMTLKCSR